jgi:hypothetical protein
LRVVALLPIALLLAGCAFPGTSSPTPASGASGIVATAAPGGLVALRGAASVALPAGTLAADANGKLLPPTGAVALPATILPPYGAVSLDLTAAGVDISVALPRAHLANGTLALDLMKLHRDTLQDRYSGSAQYAAAQAYYKADLESLGYAVVVEKLDQGRIALPDPTGLVGNAANVVATKKGASSRMIVTGGHYDLVKGTHEGAWDNTAGTVATLALAHAFANVTTDHTLVFAMWGGEEAGKVGSEAWLAQHPDLVPRIDLYLNLDVTGLAWPAPENDPDPIGFAAGPDDSPAGKVLLDQATTIETTWMRTGATWAHSTVKAAEDQGAVSDHDSFLERRIPSAFPYPSRIPDALAFLHQTSDTLENLTKYALAGKEANLDAPVPPESLAHGEALVAQSFEVQLALLEYMVILHDNGVLPMPSGLPVTPPASRLL